MRMTGALAVLLSVLLIAGCKNVADEPHREEGRPQLRSNGLLELVGKMELEETGEVLLVTPQVAPEADGGFLVVDAREAQARLYAEDGRLIRHFGRRGRGPGEFQRPLSGFRTPSGDLVVTDLAAGLMSFDSTGLEFMSSVRPPVTPLYKAVPLTDTLILLVGPRYAEARPDAADAPPLLHVFDRSNEQILHSFFETPGDSVVRQAARNFGWADAVVTGDTIIGAFALVDSIYYFDHSGNRVGAVRIPFSRFDRIRSIPSEIRLDPVRRERWLDQHQFVNRVIPLSGNRLVVQYERPRGAGNQWGVIILTRDGQRLEEHENTPMLLAVRGDTLYFTDHESELPNRWNIARIRS